VPGTGDARGAGRFAACQSTSRRRSRRPRVTAAERRAISHRHAAASAAEVRRWLAMSPPPLVLRVAGAADPFSVVPDAAGEFDAIALAVVQRALAYRRDGSTHAIHPRLVALVYAAVRQFHAPYVNVVSGYRSGNPTSRHGQGRAIDLVLPGIGDTRLAAWLRAQGFVGVGIYPTSGFVHLDVRARSYFWRDTSGPSEPSHERPMLARLAARYDRDARSRGVEAVPDVSASESESERESGSGSESGGQP